MSSTAAIGSTSDPRKAEDLPPAPLGLALHWYVVQTCAQHEKRVAEQLDQCGVDNFLPLYERVSRWKDRRVRLRVPLFPGYVFVRLALCERLRVLEIPSVARLVGFGGMPVALPDEEMVGIRSGLQCGMRAEPHPYLTIGQHVHIRSGPLRGVEGILVRRKSQVRLILSVDAIQQSMIVDVDIADVAATPSTKGQR